MFLEVQLIDAMLFGMDMDLIKQRFTSMAPFLNERSRRLFAAAEAKAIGYGGVSAVARATGISRRVIAAGLAEMGDPDAGCVKRIRRSGGGRKRAVDKDTTLVRDLEQLVEPVSRGDPESPLRWTCKSLRQLAGELSRQGHQVSHTLVAELLQDLGYSLQANSKILEGAAHPDRNAQFEHINVQAQEFQSQGQPVISVDTKKKELIGDFKNGGRELRPKGRPEAVRVHDFTDPELGKANPYGVYDLTHNLGWVNVGIDHDTAAFAVESIRRWWRLMGQPLYPDAHSLLITADGGGSNASRSRLWKVELQKLADELNLTIAVCHFPPGRLRPIPKRGPCACWAISRRSRPIGKRSSLRRCSASTLRYRRSDSPGRRQSSTVANTWRLTRATWNSLGV